MSSKYMDVSSVAKAILFDNSSNGFSAKNVQSAIEEAKTTAITTLNYYHVTDNSIISTTSNTFVSVSGMSITPVAGTYMVTFSGKSTMTGASVRSEYAIYSGGSLIPNSLRETSCNLTLLGGLVTISLNTIGVGANTSTIVTVNGSQTIDVRYRSVNGGTIQVTERNLTLIRVA